MLLLILNSHTDEGFGRNVYKNVFFLSSYIYIYIYIYILFLNTNIFFIWMHGEERLKSFINHLNSSHETIKFTSEHSQDSISFS